MYVVVIELFLHFAADVLFKVVPLTITGLLALVVVLSPSSTGGIRCLQIDKSANIIILINNYF